MSKNYALQAEARERAGKGVARALRRENKIPAVIYGDGKEAVKIILPAKEVNLEFNKGHMYNTLCDLTVGNDKYLVLARDVQTHPVKDYVEHIDFLRVSPKTKIKVYVPVHFINEEESPGLKNKGSLNVVRYDVELVCQATDMPEFIEVDLTGFDMGDAIKISNAKMPKGSTPAITDRDFTLATITAPRTLEVVEEEGEAAAEGEAAEGATAAEGEAKEE